MSFRIDDILKKDVGQLDDDPSPVSRTKYQRCESIPMDDSILQQTLLTRMQHYTYCRSLSEPSYLTFNSDGNNMQTSEKLCPKSSYCHIYTGRAIPFPYLRSQIWPSYTSSCHMTFFPHFSKRKGGQVRFTVTQTDVLEKRFISHKYLNPEDRKTLADTLKLTDRQVKTWFQNRRAKWRRSNSTSTIHTFEEKQETSEPDEYRAAMKT